MQNSLLQYGLQTMGGQLLNQGSTTLQPRILSLAYILNVVPTRIETGKSNFSETKTLSLRCHTSSDRQVGFVQ